MPETEKQNQLDLREITSDVLNIIDQERETEIITRRFGLYDRKETLEQIGELLSITRERVRQLEKAILIKLKISIGNNPEILQPFEKVTTRFLSESGRASKINILTDSIIGKKSSAIDQAHVAFLAELSNNFIVLNENDAYYHAVAMADGKTEKDLKKLIDTVVNTIKKQGSAITLEELHELLSMENPKQVQAIASLSKKLSSLNGKWGLSKWPTVNPKNIRDKIYVILMEKGKPMHFSEISDAIKDSSFKRKNVTTQAIHNELIKDKRFVLIGRGIYALVAWGYNEGTVADVIASVLRESGKPMHRDDIVKAVLKKRQVKETTVLLNLQSKKTQFVRTSKATYSLAEPTEEKITQ